MEMRWSESPSQATARLSHKRTSKPSSSRTQGKQSFKFVQGKLAKKPKKSRLPKSRTFAGLFTKFRVSVDLQTPQNISSLGKQGQSPGHDAQPADENDLELHCQAAGGHNVTTSAPAATSSGSNDSLEAIPFATQDLIQVSDNDFRTSRPLSSQLESYVRKEDLDRPLSYIASHPPFPSVSRGVLFFSLAHKYSAMFSMFNNEFCVVPLSKDCLNNPFRARESFAESHPFLSHAVMALTSHHLARQKNSAILRRETHNHWSTALQLLGTALANTGIMPLLDTILLLINLESAQSAFGMLEMHLGGASRLLSQSAALHQLPQSSRMRAQVAMLVWWDVTSALISRKTPRLADPYLNLVLGFGEGDGWSFLTLAGCPAEFVVAMARLATLSDQPGRENETEVKGILEDVRLFVNPLFMSSEVHVGVDARDLDGLLNRQYCIESWRHAILLYALRVFKIEQDDVRLLSIQYHSRMILDSARCIPPTEPFQKQVLLPVFLAGAEVGDDFSRSFVRQYCNHWSRHCHFDQFTGALAVLEDIWKDWSVANRKTYWWGVNIQTRDADDESNEQLQRELLLG